MPSFEEVITANYGVELQCQSCVDSVKSSLSSIAGITKVECDIESQIVTVTGSAAPSQVVKAIQTTGRDAIVRGTGKPNSAAVCILESFDDTNKSEQIKGLARIIAVSQSETLFDITVNGLPKGKYYPTIRALGDLSNGAMSTGRILLDLGEIIVEEPENNKNKGSPHQEGASGYSGQSYVKKSISINDLIGRSMTLSSSRTEVSPRSLCGVIARSAGVWENLKTVCSCSGKTVWQERQDALVKGVK